MIKNHYNLFYPNKLFNPDPNWICTILSFRNPFSPFSLPSALRSWVPNLFFLSESVVRWQYILVVRKCFLALTSIGRESWGVRYSLITKTKSSQLPFPYPLYCLDQTSVRPLFPQAPELWLASNPVHALKWRPCPFISLSQESSWPSRTHVHSNPNDHDPLLIQLAPNSSCSGLLILPIKGKNFLFDFEILAHFWDQSVLPIVRVFLNKPLFI